MDRVGQTLLGKYELTRMLGKGGMGEVWEGEHTLTGRRVAVKILADNYLSNRKVVARFGREARAASSVQHPGIVEILDQDRTDDGVPFLVMEFLEGESVGERIRKLGRLSQDEALAIMLPLLDALDAAHQAGIIHRDLKPDNVFILPGVRGEERIKILDFGISQKSDEIEHRLTQEGSVLGTPHYMSPEQARGEANIDARVDVYAAGVMFYECVVGDVPFDAGNYNALLHIILGQPPPSPRGRGADICSAVEQLMLATLDKLKERRPPNARVFHDLLLEAGMQEEDALLDTTNWTFNTPSEPPPPIHFEPDDVGSEADLFGAPSQARGLVDAFSSQRSELDARSAAPARAQKPMAHSPMQAARPANNNNSARAPQLEDDETDLEADLFGSASQASAVKRAVPAPRFASVRPEQPPMSRPVPPPPGRGGFDASQARGFDPPPQRGFEQPQARGFEPPPARGYNPSSSGGGRSGAGPGGGLFDTSASGGGGPGGGRGQPLFEQGQHQQRAPGDAAPSRTGPFDAATRAGTTNLPPVDRERPKITFTSAGNSEKKDGVGRIIMNWIAVLAMIAVLAYLGNIVFTRPDRKRRQQGSEQPQGPEAAQGESSAP